MSLRAFTISPYAGLGPGGMTMNSARQIVEGANEADIGCKKAGEPRARPRSNETKDCGSATRERRSDPPDEG